MLQQEWFKQNDNNRELTITRKVEKNLNLLLIDKYRALQSTIIKLNKVYVYTCLSGLRYR